MKIKHFLFGMMICVGLFLLLTIWNNVFASSNTIPQYGWCCGGTTAQARVRALGYSGWQGSCDITSSTNPSTTINIIGWNWWQCDSIASGGNVVNSSPRPAQSSPPASSRGDITQVNYCNYSYSPPLCGYTVKSHGLHVFNHTGASQWTPYNVTFGP